MEATKKNSGIGITGFVFGIVSILLSCIMIGGFTGIVGIILCIVALLEKNTKKVFALIGLVFNTIAVIVVLIVLIGALTDKSTDTSTTSTTNVLETEISENEDVATDTGYATIEKFNEIKTGMTYEEVVEIMGSEGTVMSEVEVMDSITTIYYWYSWNHISNMNITVVDGEVIAKAQVGLE